MAEVEFHAWLQAPIERDLVDGDGAFAAVHGGGEMPERIEMRRAMRGQPHPFEAPAFAVRQVCLLQAGKKLEDVGGGLLVVERFDLWAVTGRIGGDVIFEGYRDVDHFTRHVQLSCVMARACRL